MKCLLMIGPTMFKKRQAMQKRNPSVASHTQSARFIEAAKKAEADESGRKFARALKKVMLSKKAESPTTKR